MRFIRWLAAVLLLFWLISLIFRLGGLLVNMLLLTAGIIFTFDVVSNRKKQW
jgi:hypothetical protein